MPAAIPPLSLLETRVLGVLVEKQHTVPDTYPLTLNALTAGCNQKSSRDPVLEANDTEVQFALDRLRTLSLVIESSGRRVMRYAHNMERAILLESQAVALLATLMLRGPQTAGELRINSERLHRFADISAVEAFLHQLSEQPVALVEELPRALGARENRWRHRLCAADAVTAVHAVGAVEGRSAHDDAGGLVLDTEKVRRALHAQEELAALRAEVASLRADIDALKARIDRLSTSS
jgi:uncharacterized protein YceH (UPF0502 family)